jgi:hypothetical protein
MLSCGVVGAILLVLIVLFVRNRQGAADGHEQLPGPRVIAGLLSSWPVLAPGVAGGLMGAAGISFGMLWGVSYFQIYHQMSLSAASVCASFYFWGCLPGMLGSAWLCSRFGRPAVLLASGALGTAVMMALILYFLQGPVAQSVGMFVLGVFNSFYALSFTMAKDEAPEALSGVSMGLTNMLIMGIGGLIFQPLIGLLAHWHGQNVPGALPLTAIVIAPLIAVGILAVVGFRGARPASR